MAGLSKVISDQTSGKLGTKGETMEMGEAQIGRRGFKKFEVGGEIRKRKSRDKFRRSAGKLKAHVVVRFPQRGIIARKSV